MFVLRNRLCHGFLFVSSRLDHRCLSHVHTMINCKALMKPKLKCRSICLCCCYRISQILILMSSLPLATASVPLSYELLGCVFMKPLFKSATGIMTQNMSTSKVKTVFGFWTFHFKTSIFMVPSSLNPRMKCVLAFCDGNRANNTSLSWDRGQTSPLLPVQDALGLAFPQSVA